MALDVTHGNRYYEHVMTSLIELTKSRKEMEKHFDRSMRREYDQICDTQMKNVAELLKLGVECEEKDGMICLLTSESEILEFPKKEVIEVIGQDKYNILFPPTENDDISDWVDDEKDEGFDYQQEQDNQQKELAQRLAMNPFMALLAPYFYSFQQMTGPQVGNTPPYNWDSAKKNTDTELQYKIEALEKDRDSAVRKGKQIKSSYDRLKEEFDSLSEENNNLDRIATENSNRFRIEKKNLEDKLEVLSGQLEKAKAEKDAAVTALEELRNESISKLSNIQHTLLAERKTYEDKMTLLQKEIAETKESLKEAEEGSKNAEAYKDRIEELEAAMKELTLKNEDLASENKDLRDYNAQSNSMFQQVERERDTLEAEIQTLNSTISSLNSEIDSLKTQLNEFALTGEEQERLYNNLREEIEKKNSYIDKIESESTQKDNKIGELQSLLSEKTDCIKTTEESKKVIEDELSKTKTELQSTKDELVKAKDDVVTANNNIQAEQRKSNEKSQEFGNLKKENQRLQSEVDRLKNENKKLSDQKNSVESKHNQLKETHQALQGEISILKEANESLKQDKSTLEEVAYIDSKFDVGNLHKFNKRIHSKDTDVRIIALVDICNMTQINRDYEEETGDNVIKSALEALKSEFGSDNVYRVRGGQFAVASTSSYEDVERTLARIKSQLWDDMEFNIAYGLGNLKNNGPKEAVKKAKRSRNKMRDELLSSLSQPEYEDTYNVYNNMQEIYPEYNQPAQPMPEAYQEPYPESYQPGSLGNPNVNLPEYDEEEEDNFIQEVDATSYNLANEIMNMVPH